MPPGVQGYDRYAYTANNPIRYSDPSGHRNCEEDGYCPASGVRDGNRPPAHVLKLHEVLGDWYDPIDTVWPTGTQDQINIILGASFQGKANGLDGKPASVGLLYYSFTVVSDSNNDIQFYTVRRDVTYEPSTNSDGGGYINGSQQAATNADAAGAGVSYEHGLIWGADFTTEDFWGEATNYSAGGGPASVDAWSSADGKYGGIDLGSGVGFQGGEIATYAEPWGPAIHIPTWWPFQR